MTVELAVGVFCVVWLLSVYLLRASGTWKVLFAPVPRLVPDATPDPLRVAPRGWIENHSFWDLDDDHEEPAPGQLDEQVFWGDRQRSAG